MKTTQSFAEEYSAPSAESVEMEACGPLAQSDGPSGTVDPWDEDND